MSFSESRVKTLGDHFSVPNQYRAYQRIYPGFTLAFSCQIEAAVHESAVHTQIMTQTTELPASDIKQIRMT